jgi:hypothetical protein
LAQRHELFVAEEITARTPTPAERHVADQARAALVGGPDQLYTRVDLLPGPDGPLVGEVELIEPSLFLRLCEVAPARFAEAIAGRLG